MNWEAIARYLAGESPAEEQAAVRRWLAEHPDDARTIAALDDVLGRVTLAPASSVDVEGALARVKARREQPELKVVRGGAKADPFQPRRFNWIPIVAAAGIILVAGLWTATNVSNRTPPTTIAARTLLTPVGGRDSLILPDGSHVVLGPGSSLIMQEGYGQSERRVSLRGEAFFTVIHDTAKPFVVAANGVEIRDVGTAFVVHSDVGETRVAVTEGVVDLNAHGRVETLRAGDAASIPPDGNIRAQRGVGADDDLAWTTGRLVFRDAPLADVAEDLKRWYGVSLDIRDPALRNRPFSGEFKGDSLASVLKIISSALGATMERRGDTVLVRAGR